MIATTTSVSDGIQRDAANQQAMNEAAQRASAFNQSIEGQSTAQLQARFNSPAPSPSQATIISYVGPGPRSGQSDVYQGAPGEHGALLASGSGLPTGVPVQGVARSTAGYDVHYLAPISSPSSSPSSAVPAQAYSPTSQYPFQKYSNDSNAKGMVSNVKSYNPMSADTSRFVSSQESNLNNGVITSKNFGSLVSNDSHNTSNGIIMVSSAPDFIGKYFSSVADVNTQVAYARQNYHPEFGHKVAAAAFNLLAIGEYGVATFEGLVIPQAKYDYIPFAGSAIGAVEFISNPIKGGYDMIAGLVSNPNRAIGSFGGSVAAGLTFGLAAQEGAIAVRNADVASSRFETPIENVQANPAVVAGDVRYPKSPNAAAASDEFTSKGNLDVAYITSGVRVSLNGDVTGTDLVPFVRNPLKPLDVTGTDLVPFVRNPLKLLDVSSGPSYNLYADRAVPSDTYYADIPIGIIRHGVNGEEALTFIDLSDAGKSTIAQVSHASPSPIPFDEAGEAQILYNAQQANRPEDVSLYAAPHTGTSLTFLKIGSEFPSFTLNPLTWIKSIFTRPTITDPVVSSIERFPEDVRGSSFEDVANFINTRGEPGVAYITNNMELGKTETEAGLPHITSGTNPGAPTGQYLYVLDETAYVKVPSNTFLGRIFGGSRNIPIVDTEALSASQLAAEAARTIKSTISQEGDLILSSASEGEVAAYSPSSPSESVVSLSDYTSNPYYGPAGSIPSAPFVFSLPQSTVYSNGKSYIDPSVTLPASSPAPSSSSSSSLVSSPSSSSSDTSKKSVTLSSSSPAPSSSSSSSLVSSPSSSSPSSSSTPSTPLSSPVSSPSSSSSGSSPAFDSLIYPGEPSESGPVSQNPLSSNTKKDKKGKFKVEVRHHKVWINEGTFDSAIKAFGAGFKDVKNSAAASFEVIEEGRGIVNMPLPGQLSSQLYKSTKEHGVYIQPRSKRIGTSGEKQEITMKGIAASRSKRSSKGFGGFRL